MIRLNKKIFRTEFDKKDNEIYQKSIILSWVELKNFVKSEKEFIKGNFENDIIKYFTLIENTKSINNKFKYLNKIFDIVEFFKENNGMKTDSNLDEKIYEYICIKAHLTMLKSNVDFMELYMKNIGHNIEEKFKKFKQVCEKIPKINENDLLNVTKFQFDVNCKNAHYKK